MKEYFSKNDSSQLADKPRVVDIPPSPDGLVPEQGTWYQTDDGYHYPNCFADGDKLFVIYSVNKEDIECGIVNTARL